MTEQVPGSPPWWLERLEKKLEARRKEIASYEAYYRGEHRLAFATSRFREAFGTLLHAFADNWMHLVVSASVERLHVEGFRFGSKASGDTEAWRIWQANLLDLESTIVMEEAVKTGEAFLMVSPGEHFITPMITVEDPSQVITEHSRANRRHCLAGFKKWIDDWGYARAVVYLPDALYKYRSASAMKSWDTPSTVRWVDFTDEPLVENPFGVVPIVPLRNNPTMAGGGQSDLSRVLGMQDLVNKLVADLIVASEYAAFRQRWATGIEIPVDETTGQPVRVFQAAVDRMFTSASDDAKFGSFEASDLGNYVKAIEMAVQHIAAQTRTPPHYLLGSSGSFPSGESLAATETGLVAKVQEKMISFGESFEEVMRLAFLAKGDRARANAMDAETLWRDPRARTESEHVDAVMKMQALGVPQEFLWEKLGFSPQDIARMKAMQAEQALTASLFDPLAQLGPPPGGYGALPTDPPTDAQELP